MLNYPDFTARCDKTYCPRETFYNPKTCVKESKRESCYKKYLRKLESQEERQEKKKDRWQEVQREVWLRDAKFFNGKFAHDDWRKYCRIWRCLTPEEKAIVENRDADSLWLARQLDPCHVIGRKQAPELIYDVDNIVLGNRLFHSRLTELKDPVTLKDINADEALAWMLRAKEGK